MLSLLVDSSYVIQTQCAGIRDVFIFVLLLKNATNKSAPQKRKNCTSGPLELMVHGNINPSARIPVLHMLLLRTLIV